jgi:hypothetical protein
LNLAQVLIYVHNESMKVRANITLDTDAYNFVSAYASAKGIALGAAVSELIRRAEKIPEPPSKRKKRGPHGYLVMAKTGQVITPEMVKKSSEDDLA